MLPPTLTTFAGQSLHELANQFGTPCYIYDAEKILSQIEKLSPFDTIRYAQKACSNIAILDLVRRAGVKVDAVSAGEILRALAAGYQASLQDHEPGTHPDIVFTADLFDQEALNLVVEHDLYVNCGSIDMIDQYGERCQQLGRKRGIMLRINPGFGHGHSQKVNTGGEGSKHGIWHSQITECRERAKQHGLSITGIHMHIGSGTDMQHLSQVCNALEQAAIDAGESVTTISAGGGLPTPYRGDEEPVDIAGYYNLWNETREKLAAKFDHPVSLEIEPGRFLAAEAGILLTEVRAVKTMGSTPYCLVDAGFNNLARPAMYGAYHPISLCPADQEPRDEAEYVIAGPLCESGDIFTQTEGGFVAKHPLLEPKVGDWLVIGCAGAYGYTMASNYNSKPLVAEVLVQDGKAHQIRSRQSLDSLFANESIPGS